jgi:hypothetical protein
MWFYLFENSFVTERIFFFFNYMLIFLFWVHIMYKLFVNSDNKLMRYIV